MAMTSITHKDMIEKILAREDPGQFAYAPNYWQWFDHHKAHQKLPQELKNWLSQLDMIRHLGLAVFSRNIYCDPREYWFGGLTREIHEDIETSIHRTQAGDDTVTTRSYKTKSGRELTERLRYVFSKSTVVQEKFLVDDVSTQRHVLETFIGGRSWHFDAERYRQVQCTVGDCGVVIAGELFSPLKMLHLLMGPGNTIYFVTDYPELAAALCAAHEHAQLDLLRQMAQVGVKVMMAMDNLDTAFHPPHYVEQYSASFYEKAARLCHDHDCLFMIHACGQQKDNLRLISTLGVDGMEGVAYPPLGEVTLLEAMEMAGEQFIITGGISAAEIETLTTRYDVFAYIRSLFEQMRPYRNRFILSASCNTPTNASFEQILWFKEAWNEFKYLD